MIDRIINIVSAPKRNNPNLYSETSSPIIFFVLLISESGNRALTDVVAAGNAALRLACCNPLPPGDVDQPRWVYLTQ